MKKLLPLTIAFATGCLAFFSPTASAADNLGAVLKETGWDALIGTWVDPETKGENTKTTFAWKYEGELIESITWQAKKETTTLFGRNLKTGKVFVASADDVGGCSTGEVTFEKGLATFNISFAAHTGEAGDLVITYRLVDPDTLEVTFVMGQPFTIKLVRV